MKNKILFFILLAVFLVSQPRIYDVRAQVQRNAAGVYELKITWKIQGLPSQTLFDINLLDSLGHYYCTIKEKYRPMTSPYFPPPSGSKKAKRMIKSQPRKEPQTEFEYIWTILQRCRKKTGEKMWLEGGTFRAEVRVTSIYRTVHGTSNLFTIPRTTPYFFSLEPDLEVSGFNIVRTHRYDGDMTYYSYFLEPSSTSASATLYINVHVLTAKAAPESYAFCSRQNDDITNYDRNKIEVRKNTIYDAIALPVPNTNTIRVEALNITLRGELIVRSTIGYYFVMKPKGPGVCDYIWARRQGDLSKPIKVSIHIRPSR